MAHATPLQREILRPLWNVHIFIVLGLSLARAKGGQGIKMTAARLSRILLGGVVIGGLIIVGYYSILD